MTPQTTSKKPARQARPGSAGRSGASTSSAAAPTSSGAPSSAQSAPSAASSTSASEALSARPSQSRLTALAAAALRPLRWLMHTVTPIGWGSLVLLAACGLTGAVMG